MMSNARSFYLQCRVCRHHVIKDTDLKDCKGCIDSSVWYVDEDVLPKWILERVEKEAWQKGKLYCKKCNGRLGSFNFIKVLRCNVCESHNIPPIHILKDRVDKKFESPILQNDILSPKVLNEVTKEISNTEDELSFPEIDELILKDIEKERCSNEVGCSNLTSGINDSAIASIQNYHENDMSACSASVTNNEPEVKAYSSKAVLEDEDSQQGVMDTKAGCDKIPYQDFKFQVCEVPKSNNIQDTTSHVDSGIGFKSILPDWDTTDENFELDSSFDFVIDDSFETKLDSCFHQKSKHGKNNKKIYDSILKDNMDNEKVNQIQSFMIINQTMSQNPNMDHSLQENEELTDDIEYFDKNVIEDSSKSSAGAHFNQDLNNSDSEPINTLLFEQNTAVANNFESNMTIQRNTGQQMPRQQNNIFDFFLNEDITNENNTELRDVENLSYEELKSTLNSTHTNDSQDDLQIRENLNVDQDVPIGSEEGEVSLDNRYMLFSNDRPGRKGRRRTRAKREKRRQEKQTKYSEYTDQIYYDSFLIEYPEEHVCPVCYDLLCEPHSCIPCNHVMCEPCLRRVGQNMVYRTPCPMCRQPIVECVRKKDMISLLESLYPSEYRERKRNQRKYLNDRFSPLPHRARYLNHTDDDIRNRILNQRGQGRVDRMTYFLKMKLLLGGLLLLFFMIPVASLMRSCVNSTIGLVRNLWR